MGFEGDISNEAGSDSKGLHSLHRFLGEEDEDKGKFPVKCKRRYSEWREFKHKEDMKRPTFELGMEFPNSKVFKSLTRKHAVQTRNEIRFPTNTRHKCWQGARRLLVILGGSMPLPLTWIIPPFSSRL
ncbi:putative transposase, MuDR, plant [Rosa chinensis]|uniref:Putative transposase, MuDR, plant n=1 Tax=Rosa chinensis TaxID=74649 RepID=A0A2P6RY42_ROSCH|nr:putative transposase, MuDR, plant [Rosa chinensis]